MLFRSLGVEGLVSTYPYKSVENIADFNKIYIARKGSKVIEAVNEIEGADKYVLANYTGFNLNICYDVVNEIREPQQSGGAPCFEIRNTTNSCYIVTNVTKTCGLPPWQYLTSRLRIE